MNRRWNALVAGATTLFAFGLPFSTAAVAIGLALLVMALVLRPGLLREERPWREPVVMLGLVLFAYIALRTVVESPGTAAWKRLNQYQELLMLPVLLAVWTAPSHRRVFFRAFIAGSLLLALGYWATLPFEPLQLAMTKHRISSGFALAIAAFLLTVRAPEGARRWPSLAAAAFLALTVVFAMDGRTGVVVLVLLAACAAWTRTPRRWRVAAAVAAPLLLAGISLLSPAVQGRIAEMQAAMHSTVPPDEKNSSGVRIQLLRITAKAAREHWVAGVGYANYAKAHEQAAHEIYDGKPNAQGFLAGFWARIGNPHDEYVMQLVSGGVVGLGLFIAWLAAALLQARRAPPRIGVAIAGATLAFALGCVFNSLLLDFVEAHLYVAMLAWLIAEQRHPAAQGEFERIAVVATRQIGDVLLTTPLIRAARERWPDARIDVIGFEGTLGMLRGNPDVNELVEMPVKGGWAMLARLWRRYDLALVTDVGDRAHLIAWTAAPCRSGMIPESSSSNWWKLMLLDHVVVAAGDRGERHVVIEKLMLLAPWSKVPDVPQVRLPEGGELPADIASSLQTGFVVIHAPSMWPYKQWPLTHFEQLVRELAKTGRQVVLTGSSGARDQECVAPLRGIESVLDVSGRLDFSQLAALLRRAALYIGPDTSVSHLAAASGIPVIAIFGPTNPMRWAPWPSEGQAVFFKRSLVQQAGNVTLLQSELHCVPCGRAGCEDHRQSRSDCLVDIAPERVMAEVQKLLSPRA